MTAKRFEVVMNEFDEVEYIMDKAMMEDRDFAEFIDFVEDVCKEDEQLRTKNNAYIQDIEVFKEENTHLKLENEQLKTTIQQLTNDNTKQKKKLNTAMKEIEQLKEHQRTLEAKIVRLKDRVKTFEKHYSLKDIERYKKMDNCNCIDSRRLEE